MAKLGRRSTKQPITCPICEQVFEIHAYRLKKTTTPCCSTSCKHRLNTLNKTITRECAQCGKPFTFKKAEEKRRAKKYCSHECMFNGKVTTEITFYRKKAFDAYPHCCAKCTKKDGLLDVHHIDHDRTNNELSNLIILCRSCHTRLHRLC